MKILVTGGEGFLGSHVVDRLKTHHKVTTFDMVDMEDITNYDELAADVKGKDLIIHLAGISGAVGSKEKIYDYFHTNSFGTLNVLEAMRRNDVNHIIFSSSLSTYGVPKELPITENTSFNASNVYGHSKVMAEEVIRSYCEEYGLKATILRFNMLYGERQKEMNAIQSFIDWALKGEPLVIFGDGKHTREYVYVRDAVDCIEMCVDKKPNDIFLASTEKPYSINELANMIADKIPNTIVRNVPKTKFNFNSETDCNKIHKKLGWKYKTGLSEGLDRVIEWRKSLSSNRV